MINPPDWQLVNDLPNRLRNQAENVIKDGHVTAARLLHHAADELEHWRKELDDQG